MTEISTDPVEAEQRFREVNQARLDRLGASLSLRQWDLLCVIPALLHLNNPELPGFVDEQTPHSIRNYQPDPTTIATLSKLIAGFRYQPKTALQYPILSIFMMGSSGSIAFSADSDFDVWVCINPETVAADRQLLQLKFTKIEAWAYKFGIELHFFIVEQGQFHSNEELTLSGESSGSAQRFLLLEEFYRSAILLAGLPPLWWIVPAEQEASYEAFSDSLSRWPAIKAENYIDFGPLIDIPVEEFTGAGLWQIFKGIDSPYKSVMKMILMEAYSAEHPDTRLVSLDYKQKVQQGITELERLDPYLLMFEKADAYLIESGQNERAELLRHCFYLKIGEHLTLSAPSTRQQLRRNLMRSYVDSWEWTPHKLQTLDQRHRWRIDQIIAETNKINRELSSSYTRLSQQAAGRSSSTAISNKDLHVLGRRLYAALERKPGKIEIANRSREMISPEPVLAISRARSKKGTVVWLLHNQAGATSSNQPVMPLKRFVNPIELLLWCWLNSITTGNTRWLSNQSVTGLGIKELTLTNRFIEAQLPLPEVLTTSTDELAAPLRFRRLLIIVNLGHEPFADNARKGVHLASSRSDPLSYGDSKLNTVKKIDLIYTSAWGEVTCYSRFGDKAVGEALQRYLTELSVHGDKYPEPKFFGFSEHSGSLATQRVETLFSSARQLLNDNSGHLVKLVYATGPGFVLLEKSGADIQVQQLKNRRALVEKFSQPPPGPTVTRIDPLAGGIGDLALMTELNQFGAIQLFIHINGRVTHLHVMDEWGAYMTQSTETYELQSLLQHLHLFVDNITRKLRIAGPDNRDIPVTYYQLLHGNNGEWQPREVELKVDGKKPVTDIHVLATPSSSGSQALSIFFNGEEFSSLKLGGSLYEQVALQVLSHRKNRENYPVFITDVELEQPVASAASLQSIHYFKYKKSIEERLTTAIREPQVNEALPQPLEI